MTAPADPEFALAAACCRWPPTPARDAVVRAAAARIDWTRFARIVKRHRIAGLVDGSLRAAEVATPEPIALQFATTAKRIARNNLLAADETARLVRLISDAGYSVLAVKGVVLGALAYGSVAPKHSKDMDLLILPAQIGGVIALLEADGYRLTAPAEQLSDAQRRVLPCYGKDVSMLRTGRAVQLELHWRLFANTALLPSVTAASPSQTVGVGGVEVGGGLGVPTLAQPDLYSYLVLHGAVDGWSRLKWLADVNALLAGLDGAALRALHETATVRGAGAASAQALVLLNDLFALPFDPAFRAALTATPRVRMLVAGAYRLMATADGGTEIATWRGGQMLALAMQPLLGRGWRYQWRIVTSVLYLEPDMYRSAIPPALYPLYPLIRIPVWIARRLAQFGAHLLGRRRVATAA